MPNRFPDRAPRASVGFTLVELAVVVVIIGVLAAFAVPRFSASVERSKAAEAFNYLSTVHSAQERYVVRQGTYSGDLDRLDVDFEQPQYFIPGPVEVPVTEASLETGWQLELVRMGPAGGFGMYTVVFTHEGFDPDLSTIQAEISPLATRS